MTLPAPMGCSGQTSQVSFRVFVSLSAEKTKGRKNNHTPSSAVPDIELAAFNDARDVVYVDCKRTSITSGTYRGFSVRVRRSDALPSSFAETALPSDELERLNSLLCDGPFRKRPREYREVRNCRPLVAFLLGLLLVSKCTACAGRCLATDNVSYRFIDLPPPLRLITFLENCACEFQVHPTACTRKSCRVTCGQLCACANCGMLFAFSVVSKNAEEVADHLGRNSCIDVVRRMQRKR